LSSVRERARERERLTRESLALFGTIMTDEDLDELYTQACRAMTNAGEEKTELYLARLVLLLMHEIDDPQRIKRALEAAAEGL